MRSKIYIAAVVSNVLVFLQKTTVQEVVRNYNCSKSLF